ncbi:imidazole glycerol phosphate synthase subunit HisH [Spirochaetota bacterium]|nr:imidazole glycerol phosphate synthase subunit HisH [Spirochaetota bacterium]
MIYIIDYYGGNAPSVYNALKKIGFSARFLTTPSHLAHAKLVILPGVGSAKATLTSLKELHLIDHLKSYISETKQPFLGICIGYQLLFEESEEENTRCLGLIDGKVKKFDAKRVCVPQIGWNAVATQRDHPFFTGLSGEPYFYFVNSYYGNPDNSALVIGRSQYSLPFSAMIHYENIVATQFHLEKSGPVGLKVLANILGYFNISRS